jgi:DNA polymerase-3 subunit epsilon
MTDHFNLEDRDYVVRWARNIIECPNNYVILDTETTGVGKNDVVIEIAIINIKGDTLLNTRIKPTKRKRISPEAIEIHGIKMKDLENSPALIDLFQQIKGILSGKTLLIYNEVFDTQLIMQTLTQDGSQSLYFHTYTECVMLKYAQFVGEWNSYHHDYKWQRLPSATHNTLEDCQATLSLIKKIANSPLSPPKIPVKPIVYKTTYPSNIIEPVSPIQYTLPTLVIKLADKRADALPSQPTIVKIDDVLLPTAKTDVAESIPTIEYTLPTLVIKLNSETIPSLPSQPITVEIDGIILPIANIETIKISNVIQPISDVIQLNIAPFSSVKLYQKIINFIKTIFLK